MYNNLDVMNIHKCASKDGFNAPSLNYSSDWLQYPSQPQHLWAANQNPSHLQAQGLQEETDLHVLGSLLIPQTVPDSEGPRTSPDRCRTLLELEQLAGFGSTGFGGCLNVRMV